MTGIVEVERVRLSPSLIEQLCGAYPAHVRMNKVIASEPVIIRGRTFASLEIVASSFKDSVAFIDCRFSGNVVFREVRADCPISFTSCEFGGDVTLFGSACAESISLVRSRAAGRVGLDGVSTPKLDIQSLSAVELSVTAHEVPARIACLSMERVTVSGGLHVEDIAGIEILKIGECVANTLVIRRVGLQPETKLDIHDTQVAELLLADTTVNRATIRVESTLAKNIALMNCRFEQANLAFKRVVANGLFLVKDCTYVESVIDISSVTCPNLDLDESLLRFVQVGRGGGSAIFAASLSDTGRLQTLKLLKDKFAREHRYDLEDQAFYLLKNFEARNRIRSHHWWRKPVTWAAYSLSRYVLGWGVRLRNPTASAVLLVGLCALVYYVILGLNDATMSVQYLGQAAGGFYGAMVFSLLAFFGQHADARIAGEVPIPLALGQFMLGVAMTTIIVGILIRKLVR